LGSHSICCFNRRASPVVAASKMAWESCDRLFPMGWKSGSGLVDEAVRSSGPGGLLTGQVHGLRSCDGSSTVLQLVQVISTRDLPSTVWKSFFFTVRCQLKGPKRRARRPQQRPSCFCKLNAHTRQHR
jgi:hypothetical protein